MFQCVHRFTLNTPTTTCARTIRWLLTSEPLTATKCSAEVRLSAIDKYSCLECSWRSAYKSSFKAYRHESLHTPYYNYDVSYETATRNTHAITLLRLRDNAVFREL
jgi:hypothetical protein